MTAAALTSYYGLKELKELYQRYTSWALGSAIFLHALIIGSYYITQSIVGDDEIVQNGGFVPHVDLAPPPSIANPDAAPPVAVTLPAARATKGVPVPVPDVSVNPDQTIAAQPDYKVDQGSGSGSADGTAVIPIPKEIIIDEDPDIFKPVEKQPIIAKLVAPEYPEFAKRIGAEGVVWVRILVDKEGKAKKVVIVKSDNEIFNESAQKAAMQYVFVPAVMNNGPVAVWVFQPFRFSLTK